MTHLMAKGTFKLPLLFILFIFLPGLILSYFSLKNITNQKELTEQRLLEEQKQIATTVTERTKNLLETWTQSFTNELENHDTLTGSVFVVLDTLPFLTQSFWLKPAGNFLWPRYYSESDPSRGREPVDFWLTYARAESLEFSAGDLPRAVQVYEALFMLDNSSRNQALVIHGLARAFYKLKEYAKARQYNLLLLDQYFDQMDDNGVPLGYYAIYQLIHIDSSAAQPPTIEALNLGLERFVQGRIPLTAQAGFLMEQVSDWLLRQEIASEPIGTALVRKIESIQSKFLFISRDAAAIRRWISGSEYQKSVRLGQGTRWYIDTVDEKKALYAFTADLDSTYWTGFKVNRNYLCAMVLSDIDALPREFELDVQLAPDYMPGDVSATRYHLKAGLGPLLPGWSLLVKPANPQIIDQYTTRRVWVYGLTTILLVAGMSLGIVLVIRDVVREKKLAQSKSDFVANVTHELKTPLTAIRMFAETLRLKRVKDQKSQGEYLETIVKESERLTRLINNVLDFSKIEKSVKEYTFAIADISEIVRSAVRSMEYWLAARGFKLNVEILPGISGRVDSDAIEQAVVNLISNAMKYSFDHKEITVRLWIKGREIYIQVEDKGIGIPQSQHKQVFEKYFRAHADYPQDPGGAGLGLTVVAHIVWAHQGRVQLESKVQQGSCFTLILPAPLSENIDGKTKV
jgi:signal transduction histidine kinase